MINAAGHKNLKKLMIPKVNSDILFKSCKKLQSNRACLINSVTGYRRDIFGSHFFNFYHLNRL